MEKFVVEAMGMVYQILALVIIFAAIVKTFFLVKQQSVKVIERFGKFAKVSASGLNFKIPFVDRIAGELNLKLQQADVQVEAKTKDNVFVQIVLSVQYQVVADKAVDAFYKLQNPIKQIESFVFNIVRSEIPKLNLEDVFQNQDHLATAVDVQLATTMENFGYSIFKVLVTEISPDSKVAEAMNQVKASEQLKIATTNKAEADKIIVIKKAEAEAESKRLQGEGIAMEREAIVKGLKSSVDELATATNVKASDAMTTLIVTQYFDTLKAIGTSQNAKTIFMPNSPDSVGKFMDEIKQSLIASKES